jgi:hypothetical protein
LLATQQFLGSNPRLAEAMQLADAHTNHQTTQDYCRFAALLASWHYGNQAIQQPDK